ncbi:MAG: efflux RND transporter periplasmic adaptor subunit [Alkalispirochaeta sp.]
MTRSTLPVVMGVVVAVSAILTLSGCSAEDDAQEPRSIDAIHREDGVPVEVRAVEPVPFRTYMSFTSSLSGAAESTASSMVSDTVTEIAYSVGDYVEADTAVVRFPTDNPALNYEQARLNYESARTAFNRIQRLFEDDGVSQQSYDDARTRFEVARANWDSVQNMTGVRAPISGFITRINVFESDNVQPGDPLFTVSDFGELKTTVWLTDRQVRQVEVGQPARALWQDTEISGEVVQVDMAMDQTRKAFAAQVRFDNSDRLIRSGVTASVEIDTFRTEEALILNQRQVIESGEERYVFVVRDDTVHQVPVTIDRQQGLLVAIQSGLEPGDEVVTSGVDLISDGRAVRVTGRQDRLVQR